MAARAGSPRTSGAEGGADAARQLPNVSMASARASARVMSPVTISLAPRGLATRFQKSRTIAESSAAVLADSPPIGA